jgi:azurin
MRTPGIFFLLALALGLLPGCGSKTTPAPAAAGPPTNEIEVYVDATGTQVADLTADDAMRYNGNRFTVHTGQPVRVELQAIGHTPREQMMHNFVLLKADTDAPRFNIVSAYAKSTGYMPPEQKDDVLAFTPFAGPGDTVTTEFTAPAPGDYTFLCNFPGHFIAGMKGTMIVVP